MRDRVLSSIGVVLVGLVPSILGGAVFAIGFVAVALVALTELLPLLGVTRSSPVIWSGYALIGACGAIPLFWRGDQRLELAVALIAAVPLLAALVAGGRATVMDWAPTVAAAMYLGIPAFAAVDLRELTGESAEWVASLNAWLPISRDESGRGLGWLLLAVLVTWLTDTGAYLVGRSFGRRKLLPRVSPNKTVEGAVGGLIASAITALVCASAFGLGIGPAVAALVGIGLGIVGMLGDLAESMIKRHAGVKDSGTWIPGHGGVLDRIDALLFVLLATWLVAPILS